MVSKWRVLEQMSYHFVIMTNEDKAGPQEEELHLPGELK